MNFIQNVRVVAIACCANSSVACDISGRVFTVGDNKVGALGRPVNTGTQIISP